MRKEAKSSRKSSKGITLIALIVTIIVLIILAAVGINLLIKNESIIKVAQDAKDESIKQEARERMNLKITNLQIISYTEKQEMPNLQELADGLCEDEEMEYVVLESKKTASLDKIVVGNANSIFTKLKQYPYEFEINSSLQLASIDGVKVATNNENTVTREEYNALLSRIEALENNNNDIGRIYSVNFSNVSATANTSNELSSITLPAGKYVLVGFAHYLNSNLRYHISLGNVSSSAYDKNGYVAMNISTIVESNEQQTYKFLLYPSEKSVTISDGWIRAIKIGN